MKKYLSLFLFLLTFLIINISYSYGMPQNPKVTLGSATLSFAEEGRCMEVTSTSDITIITWDEFSLGLFESLNFKSPNENSKIFNVVEKKITHIIGRINSNGVLFLVNPFGILTARESIINANFLLLSTLNLSDIQNISNEIHFCGTSINWILHEGKIITKRGIVFISDLIDNQGTLYVGNPDPRLYEEREEKYTGKDYITSPKDGNVCLLACKNVYFNNNNFLDNFYNNFTIGFTWPIEKQNTDIDNSGKIFANDILFQSVNSCGLAIQQRGLVNGSFVTIKASNGSIALSGETITTEKKGHHVNIFAKNISCIESCNILAKGRLGGNVKIGNIFEKENTTNILMTPKTLIDTSGEEKGGEIELVSMNSCKFYGTILANHGGSIKIISRVLDLSSGRIEASSIFGEEDNLYIAKIQKEFYQSPTKNIPKENTFYKFK